MSSPVRIRARDAAFGHGDCDSGRLCLGVSFQHARDCGMFLDGHSISTPGQVAITVGMRPRFRVSCIPGRFKLLPCYARHKIDGRG